MQFQKKKNIYFYCVDFKHGNRIKTLIQRRVTLILFVFHRNTTMNIDIVTFWSKNISAVNYQLERYEI